ncbi:MAG: DoxX family protein [Chthoniobacterales bacterium]
MKTNTTLHAEESNTQIVPVSKGSLWVGRIMSALAALFLLVDGVMKLLKPAPVVEGTVQLGYPESVIFGLGIVLLFCVVLYVIPRTSILGAIMLTGYLGGAVASQVRVGHPLFSHTLFPVYVAALVWGGLFLREARLRALIPLLRLPRELYPERISPPGHREDIKKDPEEGR